MQGHLAWRILICQRCAKLGHACSGLADCVCGRCMRDHKVCQEVVVDGEFSLFLCFSNSKMMPRTSPCPASSNCSSHPPSPTCDPGEEGRKLGEGCPPMGRSSMGPEGDT